jgi:hypothetical protein
MNTEPADKLSILQAHDHFRHWQTLNDERLCVLCGRNFTGHEVMISTAGDETELHCPTPNCKSGVHQWSHPGNALVAEQTYEDWWHAVGSINGHENAAPSLSI